jgi:hypothetical protein
MCRSVLMIEQWFYLVQLLTGFPSFICFSQIQLELPGERHLRNCANFKKPYVHANKHACYSGH